MQKNIPFSALSSFFTKILLPFLALSLCVGCSGRAMANADGEAQGRMQILNTPQRIVVFPLFAEEMLLEMIGPDRVVYVGHEYFENGEAYSPTMELAKNIQGRGWDMSDEEVILTLNPDLIVLEESSPFYPNRVFPELYQTNTPFLFPNEPKTIEEIRSALIDLGGEVGAPEKAAQMVADMDAGLAQIAEIVSAVPEEKRARVFHYVYYTNDYRSEEEEPFTRWYRQNSFTMTACAAGVIAEGPDTEDSVDGEPEDWLIEANPDIITFDYAQYDIDGSIYDLTGQYHDAFINDLLNNPKLSNVPAIKNYAIYPIRLFESQLIVQSAKELAQLAYPNLFSEKDR
jgi:ABC-type Fe3+-hydroxamate transport system substrate-binding protein